MLYLIFALLIAVLDRLFKLWVSARIEWGTVRPLIPGLLHLTNYENTGAAFSVLSNMRWVLVTVSALAVIALIIVVLTYKYGALGRWAAAAVLGGALGNLIDRVLTGAVVDMFEVEFMTFAVFNIADIFIVVGGIGFLLHFFIQSSPGRRTQRAAAGSGGAQTGGENPSSPRKADAPYRFAPPTEFLLDDEEFTETRILEEYDIERRLSEYDENNPDG